MRAKINSKFATGFKEMFKYIIKRKNYILEIVLDVLIFGLSYVVAFYLRLDGEITKQTAAIIINTLPGVIIIRTVVFFMLKVFRGQWEYCSFGDIISIIKAISLGSILIIIFIYIVNKFNSFPRTVIIIDWMIVSLLIVGVRFSKRLLKEILISKTNKIKKILIVGAGRVGTSLINEMKSNWEMSYNPVALVDDDPAKLDQTFYGVKVYGTRMSIPHLVTTMNIDEILIALPHVYGKDMREIVKLCRLTKKPLKIVTNSLGLTDQRDLSNRIRNIKIEDLIGRPQIEIDYKEIDDFIKGKRVLVTGAAGSIGSELCRQIAKFNPEKLIAFDRSENGLFYLDRELSESFQDLDYSLALSDITDFEETEKVFFQYKPHVVFHAAAYKHVPMMELHPYQAIKNNILGTKNVVDISIKNNVTKFVLISTDKAVHPTNFMGISKRIAEQYVQACNQSSATECVAVRFGNVIGSSGSVIRIFEEQICKGGPVTVTHPDVARFFMTIPEAVQLVLQAGTLAQGGEIFILKMGELIKIYDVAKELILLSGKELNKDIKINFTGLRPGEKLIEELWEDIEECKEDFNKNLYVIRNGTVSDLAQYSDNIDKVIALSNNNNVNGIKAKMESMVNAN